jgi:hypothetical protein
VDVLKKFGMMDCKSMSTLMVTNLRKLHDSDIGSDLVDLTMYRQSIRGPMLASVEDHHVDTALC